MGGRPLSYAFWRRFAEIPAVVAIKIAPFNRYQTLDVVRAVVDAGRDDIALYTGNDDNIVADLVTPFRFAVDGRTVERRIVGGLLGHWAVWTRSAVSLLDECQAAARAGQVPAALLQRGVEVTDANAAFFDAAHGFAGCIAGIHEVLRRQGLVRSTRCLDADESSARARLPRSTASAAPIRTWPTTPSFAPIWTSGSDAESAWPSLALVAASGGSLVRQNAAEPADLVVLNAKI